MPTGEAVALAELSFISCYAGDGDQAVEWARQAQRISQDQMPGWCGPQSRIVSCRGRLRSAGIWMAHWICVPRCWRRSGRRAT